MTETEARESIESMRKFGEELRQSPEKVRAFLVKHKLIPEKSMTAQQTIKKDILLQASENGDFSPGGQDLGSGDLMTAEHVDNLWKDFIAQDNHWDYLSVYRESGEKTNISPPNAGYYECKSVARCIDGHWVGWPYYYGGGKHANPEELDWMPYAYFLNCKEEVKTIMIKTFKKQNDPDAEAFKKNIANLASKN